MNITADTNLLIRVTTRDDAGQAKAAIDVLSRADLIALPLPSLCEYAWVMDRLYKRTRGEVAAAIRGFLSAGNTVTDQESAQAGLAALDAGGDFADGVIAFEGSLLGGAEFVSFDCKAVMMLKSQGQPARLLA